MFYFQQNLNNLSNYFAYLQGYAKVFYSSTVIWSRKEHEGSYILQEAVERFPCIFPAEGDAMKWYNGQSIVVLSDSQAATQGRVSSISSSSKFQDGLGMPNQLISRKEYFYWKHKKLGTQKCQMQRDAKLSFTVEWR